MEAACYYKKLVISHLSTQWNMPEELNLLQNINCLKDWYFIKIHWPKKIGVACSTEPHSLFVLLL